MQRIILTLLALVRCINVFAQSRSCGAVDHLNHMLQQHPEIAVQRAAIEQHTQNFVNNYRNTRNVVTVPVVVHVLYNTAAQNISDAQIQSQIAVLNADFRKLNSDVSGVPAAFSSLAADCEINFCLATQDPNGAATTGIIRKSTTKTVFDLSLNDAKSNSAGGSAAWDASKYLNIWVVPSIKNGSTTGILGYAQFPGGPLSTDGVVIAHTYFGTTGTAQAPFNKGRTGTHEVGHWLNLYHIWGDDGNSCTGSDLVGDTPNQGDQNYGCPSFPQVSCNNGPNGDMFMNYMDYTDDACMFMFTAGQKARMQAVFAAGGPRASIVTSTGCQQPNGGSCGAASGLASSSVTQTSANLSWASVSGATSYTLKYGVSGGTQTTITVNGTSYALSGLTANTTYSWSVNAVCTGGAGASASANFTTLANASSCTNGNEPTNNTRTGTTTTLTSGVSITSQIGSSTDNDWYKFSNTNSAKNIKVDLTTLPADYDLVLFRGSTQVAISQLSGTSDEQIKYNNGSVTTYYVRVFGYNGAMSTSSCYTLRMSLSGTAWRTDNGAELEADVEQNINLEKVTDAVDVTVYPNPNNGSFTVDILNADAQQNATIMLVDVTGKVVYKNDASLSTGPNSFEVAANTSAGIYQLVVRTASNVTAKRVIVQ